MNPKAAAQARWRPDYLANLQPDLRDGAGKDPGPGWTSITRAGPGPADRDWGDLLQAHTDALEAWRYNAWVRQVVRLTTAYVVGDIETIPVSSKNSDVQQFIEAFWRHPENKMQQRLPAWCDELTRAGELFPVLFTNKLTGISQIRAVPASSIMAIETDPDDYEKALSYHERVPGQLEPKVWKSARAAKPGRMDAAGRRYQPEPVMLHFAVNAPVGAVRGESDLTPLLPWAQRYTDWLKQRVIHNRIKNLLAIMWVKVNDVNQVEDKREEYRNNPPKEGAILVTGPDEEISFPTPNINSGQVADDGKALRLAMATAANLSLVHFGEGDTANLSTTLSMDDRTFRTNSQRQRDFSELLKMVTSEAYRRYRAVMGRPLGDDEDLQLVVKFSDISRSDNGELATAATDLVNGLVEMQHALGLRSPAWREYVLKLALKFAGEILEQDEIERILAGAQFGGAWPDDEEIDEDEIVEDESESTQDR